MGASDKDLAFRITLIVLSTVILAWVGAMVFENPGFVLSGDGVVLGLVGLLCAWLVYASLRARRYALSRSERVVFAACQVVGAVDRLIVGLRQVRSGHPVDAAIQWLIGVLLLVSGSVLLVRTLKDGRAARDEVKERSETPKTNRKTVVAIAVLGGLVVLGGTTIPMVSRALSIAEGHMRLSMLREIGGTLQLYADTRTHGQFGWQSVSEQVRAERPGFLSSFELHDGTLVTYEVIGPNETSREVDLSKRVVIREVVHEEGRPSAALFADGHVAFEK